MSGSRDALPLPDASLAEQLEDLDKDIIMAGIRQGFFSRTEKTQLLRIALQRRFRFLQSSAIAELYDLDLNIIREGLFETFEKELEETKNAQRLRSRYTSLFARLSEGLHTVNENSPSDRPQA